MQQEEIDSLKATATERGKAIVKANNQTIKQLEVERDRIDARIAHLQSENEKLGTDNPEVQLGEYHENRSADQRSGVPQIGGPVGAQDPKVQGLDQDPNAPVSEQLTAPLTGEAERLMPTSGPDAPPAPKDIVPGDDAKTGEELQNGESPDTFPAKDEGVANGL
jgi:hypothetical protein